MVPARKPDYRVYDREKDQYWACWVNGGTCTVKITKNDMGRWIVLGSALLYKTNTNVQIPEDTTVTLLDFMG